MLAAAGGHRRRQPPPTVPQQPPDADDDRSLPPLQGRGAASSPGTPQVPQPARTRADDFQVRRRPHSCLLFTPTTAGKRGHSRFPAATFCFLSLGTLRYEVSQQQGRRRGDFWLRAAAAAHRCCCGWSIMVDQCVGGSRVHVPAAAAQGGEAQAARGCRTTTNNNDTRQKRTTLTTCALLLHAAAAATRSNIAVPVSS